MYFLFIKYHILKKNIIKNLKAGSFLGLLKIFNIKLPYALIL